MPNPYPRIVVLGTDTCSDTTASRRYLTGRQIPFEYVNVAIDEAGDATIRSLNGGDRVTPTILIGTPEGEARVLVEPSDEELEAAIAEEASRQDAAS
jgi:glutaredoxin